MDWTSTIGVTVIAELLVLAIVALLGWATPPVRRFLRTNWQPLLVVGLVFVALQIPFVGWVAFSVNTHTSRVETAVAGMVQSNATTVAELSTQVAVAQASTIETTIVPVETSAAEATPEVVTANLLKNGDFETNFRSGDWEWNENVRAEEARGFNGGKALCLIQDKEYSEESFGLLTQKLEVLPGQAYQLSGWLNWEAANAFYVKVEWYTSGWDFISDMPLDDAVSGSSQGWVYKTATFEAPINGARAIIFAIQRLDDKEKPLGSTICVDDLVFTEVQ